MHGFPKAKIGGSNPSGITNIFIFIYKHNIMYEYRATIIKAYDGDTVTAEIDLGFNIKITEKLRLLRINTPELRGDERELGLISRDRLREKILGREVIIKTKKDKKGKYGRYLAEIIFETEDGLINVNDWLVTEGLAEYKEY